MASFSNLPLPPLRLLPDPRGGLDEFFEPIHEATAFGNLPPEDPTFRQLLFHKKEDLWTTELEPIQLTEEERLEFNEYTAIANRARERIQSTLADYTRHQNDYDTLSKLLELTDTTLEDTCRKLTFLTDAFENPPSEITDQASQAIQSIRTLHSLAADHLHGQLAVVAKNLSASKIKLRLLSSMCSLNQHVTLGHACPICYSNEVDVYCDPCGHTFCKKCVKSQFCYLCRIKIKKISKLYFT